MADGKNSTFDWLPVNQAHPRIFLHIVLMDDNDIRDTWNLYYMVT